MTKSIKFTLLFSISIFISLQDYAQLSTQDLAGQMNVITTAVPLLMIAPDSRSGSMGDVGVATPPDASSMHWNPSKYAFVSQDMGVSISYTPWLRKLVNDINLAYLTAYKRIDPWSTVAASLLYFDLGDIIFTDYSGNTTGNFAPHEMSVDVAYARKFSEKVSGSLAARYIYSNLTGGWQVGGSASHPGKAFAMDVSAYYQNNIEFSDKDANLAWGINISNIGNKISYTKTNKNFIPINLRTGVSLTTFLDDYNKILVSADFNKLLVPTRPYREDDSTLYGFDSNVGVARGMIQSFYDAPGGFKEEMHEITYGIGTEYWYANQFAIRAGYFHEHETKGNRKFFTVGLGLKLNVFGLDFAYLIPTVQQHPLDKTLRFSLVFDVDAFQAQEN